MGTANDSMIDALFPKTKQRVLSLFFGQPERGFGTAELIKLVGAGSGAVQRELDRLVKCGLVRPVATASPRRYEANRDSPIFAELRGIVDKTAGTPEIVRTALSQLGASVRFAVLYGSVAKGSDRAASDVDVLIVSDDLTLEQVFGALEIAEQRLGRHVSPTMYTTEEFLRRRSGRHPFLTKVLAGKHIVLAGTEHALRPR